MSEWMLKTCALCPFSRTKTLGLHPDRAMDFADMAHNPYNDFPCHKTAVYVEDDNEYLSDEGSSGYVRGEHSKTCHGFKTLQNELNGIEDGFISDGDGFQDWDEMVDTHSEIYEECNSSRESTEAPQ